MNKAQLELSIEVSSALILVSMFQNNICLNAADKRFDTIESGLNMMDGDLRVFCRDLGARQETINTLKSQR